MVIERFKKDKVKEVYQRFDAKGRMLPGGVMYIDSWINEDVTLCFQLMQAESIEKLHEWIDGWIDLVEFEVIPIIDSSLAKKKVLGKISI